MSVFRPGAFYNEHTHLTASIIITSHLRRGPMFLYHLIIFISLLNNTTLDAFAHPAPIDIHSLRVSNCAIGESVSGRGRSV